MIRIPLLVTHHHEVADPDRHHLPDPAQCHSQINLSPLPETDPTNHPEVAQNRRSQYRLLLPQTVLRARERIFPASTAPAS